MEGFLSPAGAGKALGGVLCKQETEDGASEIRILAIIFAESKGKYSLLFYKKVM